MGPWALLVAKRLSGLCRLHRGPYLIQDIPTQYLEMCLLNPEQKALTVLRVAVAGRHPAEEENMERAARMSPRILADKAVSPSNIRMRGSGQKPWNCTAAEPVAGPHLERMVGQEVAKQTGKGLKVEMVHPLILLNPKIKLVLEEMVDMAAAAVVVPEAFLHLRSPLKLQERLASGLLMTAARRGKALVGQTEVQAVSWYTTNSLKHQNPDDFGPAAGNSFSGVAAKSLQSEVIQ